MTRTAWLVILVAGIVFLILGIIESDAFSSDVSRFFTGSATDKATWMLIGGVLGTVLGLVGLLRSPKKS